MRYHLTPIQMCDVNKRKEEKKSQVLEEMWRDWKTVHCWWECKMVLPPWKTVWPLRWFLKMQAENYHRM